MLQTRRLVILLSYRNYLPAYCLHSLDRKVDNGLELTMLPEMELDAGILNHTNGATRLVKCQNVNCVIAHLRGPAPLGSQKRLQPGADVPKAR